MMKETVVPIRDRIRELRRVKATELKPNAKNWRTHPRSQQNALRGVLEEIGYADALLARELPDGSLELIDGHLRAEITPEMLVPVLVLDVSEAEAEKILLTHDPLVKIAGVDDAALGELLSSVETDSQAVQNMLDSLADRYGIDVGDGDLSAAVPDLELPALYQVVGECGRKDERRRQRARERTREPGNARTERPAPKERLTGISGARGARPTWDGRRAPAEAPTEI